jgi:hypothetical protein
MPQTIYATSPIQKIKIAVGQVDLAWKIATFYISESRMFQEGKSVGVDESVYRRKAIQWCEYVQFNLHDGQKYKISRQDFEQNSWVYPTPSNKKAPRGEFAPKRMIKLDKLKELAGRKISEEERMKKFCQEVGC